MTISTSLITTILSPQYKLESGVAMAKGLLGGASKNPSFDILGAQFNKDMSANAQLKETISNYAPNNTKLLADLDAVLALSSNVGNQTSLLDNYISPYDVAKYFDPSSIGSKASISLLI